MSSVQVFRDEELVTLDLCLPYRKNRNYIHSADIFQSLTNLAQDRFASGAYVESLVLRRQATRQIRISFQAEPNMVGTFGVRVGEEQVRGWLVETDTKVLVRVPYDESWAAAAVVGGPGFARFTEPVAGYTAFEQLLVLLKAAGGQGGRDAWLCKINMHGPLLNMKPLAVGLRLRAMQRFFAFEIFQEEKLIGEACASLRS
jgi:hypothetical protein